MNLRHAHHNRVAVAALFLCFIVATMTVTLTRGGSDDPPDALHREQVDESGAAAGLPAACSNPVSIQAPKPDFATTVAQHPAGTCFVLDGGTYRFHDVVPKNGMAFVGVSTDTVVIDGNGHENAFHGTADGVTIAQMTFRDFNNSGGTLRQEQAPIRGTSALWASNRGAIATNWLVTDIVSSGNYASGLFLGDHWTVRNSIFHSNGTTGIAGDELVGGLIEANVIYGNGAQQAQGAQVNGGGIKITQAGTPANPVVVRNNELYDNLKIAIWCDIGCDGFNVLDNYIHDHHSRAVMYELSSNIVVRGNTILRSNTWTNFFGDFNSAAITLGESSGGLVENNLIDDARAGVVIRQTNRPASGEGFLYNYAYVNWVSSNVTVRNNIIRNTGKMGISTGTSGIGQITQPETIVFTGNSYDDPASMTFYWNNGQQLTFAAWQAAGRDTSPNGSQSSSPATQTRGPRAGSMLNTSTTTTAQPTTTAQATLTTAPTTTHAHLTVATTAPTTAVSQPKLTTTAAGASQSTSTTAPAVGAAPPTSTTAPATKAVATVAELPHELTLVTTHIPGAVDRVASSSATAGESMNASATADGEESNKPESPIGGSSSFSSSTPAERNSPPPEWLEETQAVRENPDRRPNHPLTEAERASESGRDQLSFAERRAEDPSGPGRGLLLAIAGLGVVSIVALGVHLKLPKPL